MILYHGSKSGIKGNIRAISREACDFGQGFYTGDRPDQPKGLIAEYPNNMFYELECCLDELSVKEFGNSYEEQIDWALFVAYNRGKMEMAVSKQREGILDGIFEQLKTKYRRVQDVRYFDEIIEEWNK